MARAEDAGRPAEGAPHDHWRYGGAILLVGVAMIVLPGPAFIVIPAGLALLATEFG